MNMRSKSANTSNSPEMGPLSASKKELLRQYYDVVQKNFSLLHTLGYASDPEAILGAMGVAHQTSEQPSVESVQSTPAVTAQDDGYMNALRQAANDQATSRDDHEFKHIA